MPDENKVVQAVLGSKRLKGGFRAPAEIAGLKPIESQDPSLQAAMRLLQGQGEFPYRDGWSRETRLGTPTHLKGAEAEGSMGWRLGGSDVINVNKQHPFYQMAQQNSEVTPLLASILHHENRHVEGEDELAALASQAKMLSKVKGNPTAAKAAQLFASLGKGDVVGTK